MAEVKRMRYFDGLFLKQDEFNLEQNYHIRMRRLHNRHLHTQGIVWGLDIKVESGKVVVEPGMAINSIGGSQDEGNENEDISQEIVLSEPATVPLGTTELQAGVYIYIYHKKEAADELPDRGGTDKIHWVEKAVIDKDTNKSNIRESEGKIILGRVQTNSPPPDDSSVSYFDKDGTTPLRTYAGAYGKLTLSIEKETYMPSLEGKKIDGQNGILVSSQLTRFSGALSIKEGITGGLHIGGTSDPGDKNLVVDGNCTIYGNLDIKGETTTIETKTLEVEDNVVIVNKYPPQPTPKTINGGLEVFRGGTVKNAQIIWDEAADKWKIGLEGNLADVAYGANWVALTDNSVANNLHRHSKIVSADGAVDPALNVDNSGNVGIGTGAADAENAESWGKVLDILGPKSVKLSVRTAGIDARVMAHDSGWWGAPAGMIIGTNTAHPLSFGTGSVARMTIDGSGRVCIGTSAPARKLQVDGDVLINAGSPKSNAGLEVLGTPGSWGPSVGVNNGKQEWRIVSWDDNSLKFVKITGTAFTPFTINNNSFQDALVLAAGGVGIGTSAPSEKLEVNGRIKAAAFIGDGSMITNLPIGQWFTNTKGIYYDKGYVGIGTKNPGANLEVKSGESIFRASDLAPDDFIKINATNEIATTQLPKIPGPITSSATGPAISAATLGTIPTSATGIKVTPKSTTGTMSPITSAATLAAQPVISTTVASPAASIGTIAAGPVILPDTVAGGPIIQFYEANAQKANLWWKRGGAFLINSVGTTNTSINPNGGNVGIGTTTPPQKLSISGQESSAHGVGAGIGISNIAPGGANWYLRVGATGTATPASGFSLADDIAYRLVIDKSGNVGIGTTNPQAKLDVAGNIRFGTSQTVNKESAIIFSGLNGDADKIYELRLFGRMMVTGGTNKNVRLGPNKNFATTGFRNLAHRFYTIGSDANIDADIRNNGGLTLGFTDWNADGDIFIMARFYAASGKSRALEATHLYTNSAAGADRELRGSHIGWWSDTTTNITSLVIDFNGGAFTGTVLLTTVQP